MKTCALCDQDKPSDAFYANDRTCKDCRKAAAKAWYERNAEVKRAYARQWRKEHKAEKREYARQYNRANREGHNVRRKRYEANHPEMVRARQQWKDYKKRARSVSGSRQATVLWFRERQEAADLRCEYCDKVVMAGQWEADHIVPVARGGSNKPSNLAVACIKCNRDKAAKDVLEWIEATA